MTTFADDQWQAEHRRRLAETIRRSAAWRKKVANEYEHDREALRASLRAANALRTLANFVDGLADDDRDLRCCRHATVFDDGNAYVLCPEGLRLLSRFWVNRGSAASKSKPDDSQMRNVLRRMDGAECASRGRAREAS